MSATPAYQIDDEVFLIASAKIGFLESYRITSIHSITANKFAYQINIREKGPSETTVGDYINTKYSRILYFGEEELTDFCGAINLQVTNLQRRLADAQARQDSRCQESN